MGCFLGLRNVGLENKKEVLNPTEMISSIDLV